MIQPQLVISINSVLQDHMKEFGLQSMTEDQAAELVFHHATEFSTPSIPLPKGFTFREIITDIRKSYNYIILKQLLGVEQKDNKPRGKYIFHKFDAPPESQVRSLLNTVTTTNTVETELSVTDTVTDYLSNGLDVVFVGTSIGVESAKKDGYYPNSKNRFWDLVNTSNLVTDWIGAENCKFVLEENCGLTDLVKESIIRSQDPAHNNDYDVKGFMDKMKTYKPRVVAFNGREAFREVFNCAAKECGLSDKHIGDSKVFVLPSSSGTDTSLTFHEKLEWYKKLKSIV